MDWRRRVNQRVVGGRLRELGAALQTLEVAERALPHTRHALRDTRATLETVPYGSIVAAAFATMLSFKLIKAPAVLLRDLAAAAGAHSVERAARHYLWIFRPGAESQPLHGWDALIYLITCVAILITPIWWIGERRLARGAIFRHQTTIRTLEALRLCAAAYTKPPGERAARLRELDQGLQVAEDAILRAYRYAGSIPHRSARRSAARMHAAKVAGALRAASLRVDVDPEASLRQLGAMLAEIGERCAEGRIGSLLPEEALEEVIPVSATRTAIRESVHMAVVIVAAMLAAVGASFLLPVAGVNDSLRPWLIVGCSVLAAILVGGWHRVGRILELVPGK
ncbi:hypothetical protein AB0G79_00250 [Streptomyces sp. NPDC020807]|uniref:hypothetical protein n=1 Tax=Streptomyces sp. NPDC020807 TaxID=3155119 RepID=UPI00340B6023